MGLSLQDRRYRGNNTIDVLLTENRGKKAAKRFFDKDIEHNGLPAKITTEPHYLYHWSRKGRLYFYCIFYSPRRSYSEIPLFGRLTDFTF